MRRLPEKGKAEPCRPLHKVSAGLLSLTGVALGFVVYLLAAAFGLSDIPFAAPYA